MELLRNALPFSFPLWMIETWGTNAVVKADQMALSMEVPDVIKLVVSDWHLPLFDALRLLRNFTLPAWGPTPGGGGVPTSSL